MHRLFLALMIVLLPLRGWIGDAMAMELLDQALPPPTAAHALQAAMADSPHAQGGHMSAMHADCPGHAGMPSAPSASAEEQHGHTDGSTCTACQICHAVGLTPIPPRIATAPLASSRPQGHASHFSSAERAPGFKPPIS